MNSKAAVELGSAFAGRFLSAGGVLTISILLSRQLPLAQAGIFFEGFTVLMGMAVLTRCGQELRLLRMVARQGEGQRTLSELAGSSSIVVLASLIAGLPFFIWWAVSGTASPLKLLWLPLIPTAMTNVIASYIKGTGKTGLGALGEVGSISLVATAWFAISPAHDALSAWLAMSVAAWGIGLAWWVAALALADRKIKWAPLRASLVMDAWHLWLVSVLSYVAQWGVVFIVAMVMSRGEVAIMNALLRLLAPLQFVILTLDYFVAPRFARGTRSDIVRVRRRSILTGLGLAAPYAALLLLDPGPFLAFVYGTTYGAYGNELRILIAGTLFQMALGPSGILLNMLSRDREMTISVVLRIVLNLGIQALLFLWPALWLAAASYSGALIGQYVYLKFAADRATNSHSNLTA